jgi:hypothetical protein
MEVKLPGREADHSPPTSAEVKKTWISKFIRPYVFMRSRDSSVGIATDYGLDDQEGHEFESR